MTLYAAITSFLFPVSKELINFTASFFFDLASSIVKSLEKYATAPLVQHAANVTANVHVMVAQLKTSPQHGNTLLMSPDVSEYRFPV